MISIQMIYIIDTYINVSDYVESSAEFSMFRILKRNVSILFDYIAIEDQKITTDRIVCLKPFKTFKLSEYQIHSETFLKLNKYFLLFALLRWTENVSSNLKSICKLEFLPNKTKLFNKTASFFIFIFSMKNKIFSTIPADKNEMWINKKPIHPLGRSSF